MVYASSSVRITYAETCAGGLLGLNRSAPGQFQYEHHAPPMLLFLGGNGHTVLGVIYAPCRITYAETRAGALSG